MIDTFTMHQLSTDDVSKVIEIQRDCYSEKYIEDYRTFLQMKIIYPWGCWGVKKDGSLAGYVFFHPYYDGAVKPLNHTLVPDGSEDCMYLHDIAIHHLYRGLKLSKMLLEQFDDETARRGYTIQCLVAVQNSHDFWGKRGFNIVRKIENYGRSPAHYMRRCLQ